MATSIELREVGRHPLGHAGGREFNETPRDRRLRAAVARRCRNIAAGKPNRTAEPAGRDVDQHEVHRPLPKPVLGLCRLPARQGKLGAVTATHARPFDRDRATVKADLPLGPPPAMPGTHARAAMARPAQPFGVLRHHAGERGDPRRQAEALEARPNILPSIFHQRRRIRPRGRDNSSSWRCLSSWSKHPEPTGSRRATPTLLFQHRTGHLLARRDGA